jgi:predicted nucleic acid-binding protein
MSGVAVVDTSVLVDALVVEASRHSTARRQLAALDKIVLPTIVIYELVWVMKRLGAKETAVRSAVEALVSNPKVVILADDGRLASRAIGRLTEERKDLSSFDDKVILESALKEGVPLVTYDTELRKEADRAGVGR